MASFYTRTGNNRRASGKNVVAQVVMPNGTKKRKNFKEKKEAKRWAAIQEGKIAEGAPSADAHQGTRSGQHVRDALALYRETAPKRLEHKTWHECERPIVEYWEAHPFADQHIEHLFYDQIQAWIAEQQHQGRPAATIRKRLDVFRRVLETALIRWRLNIRNPAAGQRVKRGPKTRRRPTAKEKKALYQAAIESRGTLIYWALRWAEECGMRRATIARLKTTDIDFTQDPPVLTIDRDKTNPRSYYMWDQLIELYEEIRQVSARGYTYSEALGPMRLRRHSAAFAITPGSVSR